MSSSFNLALFGAGHVGSAVVATMAGLDCNVRWIDSRREIFPGKVPANVTCLESESPPGEVAAMPANAYYLVMTHSHPLDFEICSRILARGDFAYCGLIGSVSKRRRFEKQMREQGMAAAAFDRLTCPVGIAGIDSKKPEAIAIAVAAQLLQTHATSTALCEPAPPNLIRAL
jgi:xanthine dehydrogenase accessory factor